MKTLIVISLLFAALYFVWFRGDVSTHEINAETTNGAALSESVQRLSDQAVARLRAHRTAFAGIIEQFNDDGKTLEASLDGGKESLLSFKEAVQESRDRDSEFNKVYSSWQEVERQSEQLHARFRELVAGAEQFYAVVRERAESIRDDALRGESLAFINKSEQAYAEQLKRTQVAIRQVDAMKVRVDDVMLALEIRFAVEVVDQRLGEIFFEIDSMIESVLGALRALEEESQSVLRQLVQ